ncbi:DUF6048 family protein [uncultured Polaribacter sp.]|uniref:DUF6048 family protein n=1 Tax=uncultured Polaribacter sp. TaxID=174711 RepID=UPI00261CF02D|nr:DUF6048 family protein [uncultured Polaribacter sp.]
MYKYFTSLVLLFVVVASFGQQKKDSLFTKKSDTLKYKTTYGLRLGVDISRPILASLNSDYTGFEIVGDYRIKKNLYIAAEVGFEEETTEEFRVSNSTSKGNFIRLGINYNAYKNWLNMNNEVFIGYRYGFALFNQTLNSFTPNVSDPANNNFFTAAENEVNATTENLNAHWSELMVGVKVETLKNVFVGFNVSYKIMMSVKDPENFKSLFAPGFNRIFETNTGFGFNYTISYQIPFTKK